MWVGETTLSSPPTPLVPPSGALRAGFGVELSWLQGEACQRGMRITSQFIKSLPLTSVFQFAKRFITPPIVLPFRNNT